MVVQRRKSSSASYPRGKFQSTRVRIAAEVSLIALAAISLLVGRQDLVVIKEALQDFMLETDLWLDNDTTTNQNTTSSVALHNPQRFTHNLDLNIKRGLNIVNCWTGQTIASWIYHGEEEVEQKFITWKHESRRKLLKNPQLDAPQIQDNDTIYVAIVKLSEFTHKFLPFIENDFVLITETWHLPYPNWIHELSSDIVNHPNLLQWFSNNVANYTGGQEYHPKVSPFPLGLKPNMPGAKLGSYRAPVRTFRKIFLETLHNTAANKTEHIYVGYIRETNELRKGIPSGPNLDYPDYLRALASAHYVLSPDGDHPDCHRHYEALGMNAIPITGVDPFLYRHLAGGPVIFNNTNWNVTSLRTKLPDPTTMQVNRNIVFEEYWMEHVEQVVGRPLRWWDVVQKKKCFLDEFAIEKEDREALQ